MDIGFVLVYSALIIFVLSEARRPYPTQIVTPSTTTHTAGDPPGADVPGEGLGEGLGGPGWEVGEEPGVGAPDVGGAGVPGSYMQDAEATAAGY